MVVQCWAHMLHVWGSSPCQGDFNIFKWTLSTRCRQKYGGKPSVSNTNYFFHGSAKWGICKGLFHHLTAEFQWLSWLRRSFLCWRSWVQIPTQLCEVQSAERCDVFDLFGVIHIKLRFICWKVWCVRSLWGETHKSWRFVNGTLHLIALCPISLTGVKLKCASISDVLISSGWDSYILFWNVNRLPYNCLMLQSCDESELLPMKLIKSPSFCEWLLLVPSVV